MTLPIQPTAQTVTDRFGDLVQSVTEAGLRWVDSPDVLDLAEVPPGTVLLLRDTIDQSSLFITNEITLTLDCVLQVAGGRRAARAAVHALSERIREDRSLGGYVRHVIITQSTATVVEDDPRMGIADLSVVIQYEGLGA
ncbi:MAG: hypothetical protein ACO3RX_00050 [Chthoniobacterales bacterium]